MTALLGLRRNLTAGEIVGQVLAVLGDRLGLVGARLRRWPRRSDPAAPGGGTPGGLAPAEDAEIRS